MSEIIKCKNCGKQIMKLHASGDYWVHVGELLRECYPDTVAEPEEEKCEAEILINHQIYKCVLNRHDNKTMHRADYVHTHLEGIADVKYHDMIEW